MLELPGGAPFGMCWSRRGRITAAGLAFACFITVGTVAPQARADSQVPTGSSSGFKLPAEDQRRTEPAPVAAAVDRPNRPLEVCPVDRPHRYIDDFGYARAGHRHQGNDIMAPAGTPIRAPFAGTAKKSVSAAGGLGVYVYGKRGFVFNAHLSRLGKTGKVKAGDVIGYVGNSGNARGGSPHDHFEWHPGGGKAVSPFRLLKAACRAAPASRSRRPGSGSSCSGGCFSTLAGCAFRDRWWRPTGSASPWTIHTWWWRMSGGTRTGRVGHGSRKATSPAPCSWTWTPIWPRRGRKDPAGIRFLPPRRSPG